MWFNAMKMNSRRVQGISRSKQSSYFRDLREFISHLEETGNLHRISDADLKTIEGLLKRRA